MMSEQAQNSSSFNRKRCASLKSDVNCKRSCPNQTVNSSQIYRPDLCLNVESYCVDNSHSDHHLHDSIICHVKIEDFNINDLPVTILLRIFGFLSMGTRQHCVALVCRYWLQLSRDSWLWRLLDMRGQVKITDTVMAAISNYCRAVIVLDISDCHNITDNGVTSVLQACPRIVKLRLARCTQLTNAALKNIGVNHAGESLREIDISSCWLITDNVLWQISTTCLQLTRLTVNQCTKLTNEGVLTAVKSLNNLQELSLDECTQLSDECLNGIITACFHLKIFSCKSLNFTAKAISRCSKLKELSSLDLTGVKSVNDEVVCSIIDGCKGLKNLFLSLCTHVSDVGVKFIAQYSKNLTTLHLVSCNITDEAIRSLARYCRQLQVLDVGYCDNLTDESVCEIVDLCCKLRYLGLMRCDRITTATVASLVDKYPQIVFSTVYLEMKRLIDAAHAQGLMEEPLIIQ